MNAGERPLLLAGLLFLGGCVGPPTDLSRELKLNVPEAWTGQEAGASKVFEAGWLENFGDPVLEGLVEEALTHNYDLQTVAARVRAAQAATAVSGAELWPQIAGNLSGNRAKTSSIGGVPFQGGRFDNFKLSLDLSWEMDLWGRIRDARSASVANWQASEADYRAARLSLAGKIGRAWFNAIEAELQLRLAEKSLESFEANLSILEERFRAGIANALDLRLTRANVAGARDALHAQFRQRDIIVRSLEILLGRYPSAQLELVETLPEAKLPVPAGLPADLLKRRPDIVAAERRFAAAAESLKIAQKDLLPRINLAGSGGTSGEKFDALLDENLKVWQIGGNLSQPVFQGGRLQGRIRQSRAEYEAALAAFREVALRAFREVETALAALSFTAEQKVSLQKAVEEYSEAEKLAWDRYQKGLEDIITVLESQRRAFEAKRRLLSVANLLLQNQVDIHLALGGDFK